MRALETTLLRLLAIQKQNKHGGAHAEASGEVENINDRDYAEFLQYKDYLAHSGGNSDIYESRIGRGGRSDGAFRPGRCPTDRGDGAAKDRAESSLFKTNVAVDKDFDSFQAYMVGKQQQRQGKQQQVSDMNFDGRVEPPGRPIGGVEGPTPRGEGSVIINTQTASANSDSDLSYPAYARWVMQQQQLQQQQYKLHKQQQREQQWAGLAEGLPSSTQSTLHNQHPQQQQQQEGETVPIFSTSGNMTIQAGLRNNMGILPPDLGGAFGGVQLEGMQLLNSLRVAAESNARRRSKVWLYPDYHLDYDKGYEQMTHAELFFGMSCVINDLLEGKSALPRINAKSYAKHMKYVAKRGLCKNYKPGTLNRYEHKLTTKVLEGKLESFVSADYDTVASYLGADS